MKGKLFQVLTAFACSFGQTVMGLMFVWPSYTSTLYSSSSTPLTGPMSEAEISLLGSLPSLGAMFGSAICGLLIDKLGRRDGGVLLALPYMLCWAIISATTSTKLVLAARFVGGIAGGGLLVYAPIFISEVTEPSVRGSLATVPILMYCCGTMLSYVFGWLLTYTVIIWTNLVLSAGLVALIAMLRESPIYLLRQKREEDSKASIAHYRGCSPSSVVVLAEFTRLKTQIYPAAQLPLNTGDSAKAAESEKEKLNLGTAPEEQKKMSPVKLLFVTPSSRRGFLVVFSVITMQIFMGVVPVQVYAKSVFTQADPANADMYPIIFAAVLTCGVLLSASITDKAGRRVLLISSSLAVTVCIATLGFLLQSRMAPPWVAVVLIMCYCFSFSSGVGSVPYVLLAEVFVPEVQGIASMLIIEWVWFLNFAVVAIFPVMNNLFGIHGSFYAFSCWGLANSIFCYFIVPETKGLSNVQIQDVFLGNKKN